jgi:hypothetical protein
MRVDGAYIAVEILKNFKIARPTNAFKKTLDVKSAIDIVLKRLNLEVRNVIH